VVPTTPVSSPVVSSPTTPAPSIINKILVSDVKDLFAGEWKTTTKPLFKDGISLTDVRQGGLLDCWYLSTLAAYAYQSPDVIANAVKTNSSGGYDITLQKRDSFGYGTTKTTYSVSNTLAVNGPGVIDRGDTWVAMFEKAGAKAADTGNLVGATKTGLSSYSNLNWGYPAFSALGATSLQGSPSFNMSVNLDEGRAAISLWNGHFWAVCDTDSLTGRSLLYNPYGYYQDTTLDKVSLGAIYYSDTINTTTQQSTVNDKPLTSTTGKDTLTGGAGNDILTGLAGNDFICGGGAGIDWLTGGVGKDTFDLRGYNKLGGQDLAIVQDFWSVQDKVILTSKENYSFGAVTYDSNLASRDIFQTTLNGNDLVAKLQGSAGDLSSLTLGSSCFQYM
jgi:Ca2+-binding RTX toxin-like protein